MEPEEKLFDEPAWKKFADWKTILRPHYDTARKMLGVARNPRLWAADVVLKEIAQELKTESTFRATDVGVFLVKRAKKFPIHILAAKVRRVWGVFIAAGAWSAAVTMPRTRSTKTIYTSPRNAARKFGPSATCKTFALWNQRLRRCPKSETFGP